MKTVQLGTTVKRLDDETADRKVRNEGYSFVPKKVWKEIRDAGKAVITKDTGRTAPPPVKKSKRVTK